MINFIKTIFLLIICSGTLISKPIIIKLATLAPEGTEYYNLLLEMGQRWQEETNGEIILRIYPNGVVGRESDTIRKMRIGQIQASAMSSIGLADLTDQIQAFTIPMVFKDYDDVEKVKEVMFDDISNGLSESGFKLLFLVDIGWVYWFSVNEIAVPEDLRNAKIYTTAGDYITVELFKRFGFNAIPVSETDILISLQTGMINSMQTVPILSLSSGWFALMPNMLDLKWAVFIGAVIIDERVWSKIRPEHQKVMMEVAQEIGKKYQENGRKTDAQAIEMMKKYGMKVKTPTDEELKIWEDFKEEIKGKNVICVVSGSNNDITRTAEIKERALLHANLKHYFIVKFPQRAGALREFVVDILGENDDITHFEYTKKTNRENGAAVVGVELKSADDLEPLITKMKLHNFYGDYLNNKPELFQFLV